MGIYDRKEGKKSRFSASNIFTGVMIILLVAMIVSPDAKSLMLQGLMKIGLFKPDIPNEIKRNSAPAGDIGQTSFQTEDGNVLSLAELKGKVVLLNFWATWCPPCRAEMPSLDRLYKKFKNDKEIVFLAVDADGNQQTARAFLDKYSYELPLALPSGAIARELFSGTLPTTVILDKAGRMVMHHDGVANYDTEEMESFLQRLRDADMGENP